MKRRMITRSSVLVLWDLPPLAIMSRTSAMVAAVRDCDASRLEIGDVTTRSFTRFWRGQFGASDTQEEPWLGIDAGTAPFQRCGSP